MDEPSLSEEDFRRFRDLIYGWTGIVLADGKRHLVESRLRRRLRHHSLPGFGAYLALVTGPAGSDERETFINCITTNKTDFFREPHHFEFIARRLVPEHAARAGRGVTPRLRVWHAGCSTGEEPYTLAMTLADAAPDWDVRQFATDIDTDVLAHAARGVYSAERVATLAHDILRRWFLRGAGAQDGYYKVRRELREQITFRQLNLLDEAWPMRPDTRFDLIFCRNVVIYFDKQTQRRLFARFAERLRPGGTLIIGHSESLLGLSDAFESVGQTIYRLPEAAEKRRAA